jgi:hypothetical protein
MNPDDRARWLRPSPPIDVDGGAPGDRRRETKLAAALSEHLEVAVMAVQPWRPVLARELKGVARE